MGKRYVVMRYNICTTKLYIHAVYERSGLMGPHSTITTIKDEWYGRVGTDWLTPELDALPAMSQERIEAVRRFFDERYALAYRLIHKAFPGLEGRETSGEIEAIFDTKVPDMEIEVEDEDSEQVQEEDC